MKLKELLKLKSFLKLNEDSVIIFKSRSQQWLEKQVLGQERRLSL